MELNRFGPARDYLRLARAEFAKTGDLAAQADALLLEAKATRALCGAAEAQPLVAQALALPVAAGQDARNALAYALKADMACDAGDTGGARAALSVARKWAERGAGDPVLLAELARADARLLATAGDQAQAAQQFTQAAALFGRAGRHRQMAEALGLAARAYEAADQWAPAGERYLAAARSRFAQGDLTPALKDVNAALACAQRSGREDVKQRAQVLLNEISDAVEKAKSTAAQPAAP
jgi:gas vesicle protein